jgi:glutathione S-transferase
MDSLQYTARMLTLHLSPATSSMAVHIALHEIGQPFDTKVWTMSSGTRSPEYLAINPAGKVPALMVDGTLITEVAGGLFYLAKRYPEARLLPAADPLTEARAVAWMSFLASTVHPARAKGKEALTDAWTLAEKKLGQDAKGGDWVLGGYSIVDIHLFRLYWRMLGTPGDRPTGLKLLDAHYQRMMKRPAVQKTIAAEKAMG